MKYSQFFEIHSRLAGRKKIAIVRPEYLESFVIKIASDTSIDLKYKAFLLTSLSGGMRVSEALALSKNSFSEEGGDIYVRLKVLKKRKYEDRLVRIHPEAVGVVKSWLSTVVGKPFKFSESTALRKIKEVVGLNEVVNHSLRHSLISYLLFEKGMTHIKAAKLIHIGIDAMMHYSHLNERRAWGDVF